MSDTSQNTDEAPDEDPGVPQGPRRWRKRLRGALSALPQVIQVFANICIIYSVLPW